MRFRNTIVLMTRIAGVFPVIDEHGMNLIQKVEQALAIEKREDLKILGQGLLATLRKHQKTWAQNIKGEKRVKPLLRTESKSSSTSEVVEVAPPSKPSTVSRPAESAQAGSSSSAPQRATASGTPPTGPRSVSRTMTPPPSENVPQSEPLKTTSIRGLAAAAAREREEAKEKALASMKRKIDVADDGISWKPNQEQQVSRTGEYRRPSKPSEEHEAQRREDPAQRISFKRNDARVTPPRSGEYYKAPVRGVEKYVAETATRHGPATTTDESLTEVSKSTTASRDRSRANSPVPQRPPVGQSHSQRTTLLNHQADQDSPRIRSRDEPLRARERRDERVGGRDVPRLQGRNAGWDNMRRGPEGSREPMRPPGHSQEDRNDHPAISDPRGLPDRGAAWDEPQPANAPGESNIPTGPAADRSKTMGRGAPDSPSGRKRPREELPQSADVIPPSAAGNHGEKRLKIDRTHASSDDLRRDRTYTDDSGEEVKIRGRGGSSFAGSALSREPVGWSKGPSTIETERDRVPDESGKTRREVPPPETDAMLRERERPRDERRRERDSERGFARDRDRRGERGGGGGGGGGDRDRDRDGRRPRGGRGRDIPPANQDVGFSDARLAAGGRGRDILPANTEAGFSDARLPASGFRSAEPVPDERNGSDGREGHRRKRGRDDRRSRRQGYDDL